MLRVYVPPRKRRDPFMADIRRGWQSLTRLDDPDLSEYDRQQLMLRWIQLAHNHPIPKLRPARRSR